MKNKNDYDYQKAYGDILSEITREAVRLGLAESVLYGSKQAQQAALSSDTVVREKQTILLSVHQRAVKALRVTNTDQPYNPQKDAKMAVERLSDKLIGDMVSIKLALDPRRQSSQRMWVNTLIEKLENILRKVGIEMVDSRKFSQRLSTFAKKHGREKLILREYTEEPSEMETKPIPQQKK